MQMPQPSEIFAERYRLESVLGDGGFATVFLATDLASSRKVALKILRQQSAGGYTRDVESRFDREVRIIAQLTDPHTVTLYDFGRSPGNHLYMVFEYIPGRDLSQVLAAEGRLAAPVAVHIVRQVLESLSEAHKLGLLHRDIKPENIRIYSHGTDAYRAKVLDFGIARPAEQARDDVITREGELIGTPRYMAPEQLVEQDFSAASDIYSLGLVAFEMLLGRDALQGYRWSDQFDRLTAGHVFAIEEVERVGPGLRAIVQQMTQREPRDRYQSADAVLWALDALTRHDSVDRPALAAPGTHLSIRPRRPTPTAAGTHTVRFETERDAKGWMPILGAALFALVVVGAAVFMLTKQDSPQLLPPPSVRVTSLVKQPIGASENPTPVGVIADVAPADADADPTIAADAALGGGCGDDPGYLGYGTLRAVAGLGQWDVHVPDSYVPTREHPIIFLFHQDARTGRQILEQSLFRDFPHREFVIVAPTYPGNAIWSWRDPAHDVPFVRQILDEVMVELCIDPDRVFAVGHGAGGHVVEHLSCEPWIKAVATNSFRSDTLAFICPSGAPVPSLYLTPLNSKRMPIGGGTDCAILGHRISLVEQEEKWFKRNGCASRRQKYAEHPNGTCWRYEDCEELFVSCGIDGGAGWPGSAIQEIDMGGCGDIAPEFPASETIMKFFHSISG